jgi:anaerobic selenocysteine-containing dehydrogenase
MPETKKASCLFCSFQCGFALEVDRGIPVRIDLDPEARQNKGALCVRGHYNLEILEHPKRFLAATVNRRRVPRTSALTKVAGAIADAKAAHGGNAVGIVVGTELSNEDYDAAVEFAAKTVGTQSIAVAHDGADYPLLAGGGPGDAAPEDMDGAEAVVLVGDVFWGHPCLSKRIIASRHASRTNRIYTVNPYRSNTDWFADRHVAVRPGGEPLFLAALLTAMNAQGVPRVDLEKAAAACGMTAGEIDAMAKDLKGKKKVLVLASSRLGDSTSAYLTGMLAAKLAHACGGKYAPLFRGGNAIGAHGRVGSKRTVPEIVKDIEGGKIKTLLVFGPDILQLYPGVLSTDALEGLSFLAASSIFENDTTKRADVGLPQSAWTEGPGAYSASFGLSTTIEPAVAPQGDAAPVREILAALAEELGAPLSGAQAHGEHPAASIDAAAALARLAAQGGDDGVSLIENISPIHRWDGAITGRMAFAQSLKPYCEIWIGEGTASRLGIRAGENATVSTDKGETTIIATVTDRMPDGLIAIPTYVPDARGLMVWTANAATRWFDVAASGAAVRSGS